MSVTNIVLPSKPKVVLEEDHKGQFEIDGLYPGYGHTLGNSLRRIILSSLPGAAITSVKIKGADHEFSTLDGVKEDVITILLNLKNVRIQSTSDEPVTITLQKKGEGEVTAGDIDAGAVEVLNKDLVIAHLTDKKAELDVEITVERGLGYVPKEVLQKEKVDIGTLAMDAVFTPIRRVSYEVENMRVGDRTDFNRLRIFVETDGTITPREALEQSIEVMINQLKAVVGFKEETEVAEETSAPEVAATESADESSEDETEYMKTRIESVDLGSRTLNALSAANIRTVGGLVRKTEADILEIEGLGDKGLKEIKKELKKMGLSLKE